MCVFSLQIRKRGHFPMPELQLSISFPNLTADGYPVLYPIGWSSSDVSNGWFSILSLLFLFKIPFKNSTYTRLFILYGGLVCLCPGAHRRSENNLQQSALLPSGRALQFGDEYQTWQQVLFTRGPGTELKSLDISEQCLPAKPSLQPTATFSF